MEDDFFHAKTNQGSIVSKVTSVTLASNYLRNKLQGPRHEFRSGGAKMEIWKNLGHTLGIRWYDRLSLFYTARGLGRCNPQIQDPGPWQGPRGRSPWELLKSYPFLDLEMA